MRTPDQFFPKSALQNGALLDQRGAKQPYVQSMQAAIRARCQSRRSADRLAHGHACRGNAGTRESPSAGGKATTSDQEPVDIPRQQSPIGNAVGAAYRLRAVHARPPWIVAVDRKPAQ